MSVPALLRCCAAALGLVLAPVTCAVADDAPRPGVAGDGGHLWLVAPAPSASDGWQVLHRSPGQAGEASPVPGYVGQPVKLADGAPAICARGDTLVVAEEAPGGGIQLDELHAGPPTEAGVRVTRRDLAALPKAAHLLAMAADKDGLWLAVEASPSEFLTLVPKNAAVAPSQDALALALGLPPGVLKTPETKSNSKKQMEAEGNGKPLIPEFPKEKKLLLLHDSGAGIEPVIMFPAEPAAWMASDGKQVLLVSDSKMLWWRKEVKEDIGANIGPFGPVIFIAHQAILAQVTTEHALVGSAWSDTLHAKWSVLRGKQRNPAGECSLPLGSAEGHGLVEWEGHAALATVAPSFAPGAWAVRLAPVDLNGAVLPTVELRQVQDPEVRRRGVYYAQGCMVLVAIGIMVFSWRRGVRLLPNLPQDLERVGLLRRLLAVAADLVVAVAPLLGAGVPLAALHNQWPALSVPTSLEDMRFVYLAAGLFIAHTMLGEMLFGRSLGKALVGLKVVGLDGKPAAPWRIALRGVLKILELFSPMLFVVAIFSPFAQRLGDLAAGTVVVAQRRPEDPS